MKAKKCPKCFQVYWMYDEKMIADMFKLHPSLIQLKETKANSKYSSSEDLMDN